MNYWHELPQEEVKRLVSKKVTIGYILKYYKQPNWCNCPEALSGAMGCWGLMDSSKNGLRLKISEDFCKSCDCFNKINKKK